MTVTQPSALDVDAVSRDASADVVATTNLALREQLYEQLTDRIRAGKYVPGEALTIRGLAASLGTSTMPVREVVSRLVNEGAVQLMPNRTMRIPTLSPGHLKELVDLRSTVEGRAAWLAAENMNPAEFTKIKIANEAYSHAVDVGDVQSAIAANEQMHFAIYEAAHSELLLSVVKRLWLQSGPYIAFVMSRMQTFDQETLHDRGIMHHFNILAALAKRDPQAASDALKADIVDAARWWSDRIFTQQAEVPPAAKRGRRGRAPKKTD